MMGMPSNGGRRFKRLVGGVRALLQDGAAATKDEELQPVAEAHRLQKRAALLAKTEEIADTGSWEWDIQGNAVTWSDQVYRIFGVDRSAWAPNYEGYLQLVHPDDRGVVQAGIKQALRTGTFEFSHRLIRPDGQERVVQCLGEAIFASKRRAQRLIGIVRDITDERRSRASEAHLAAILASSTDAILSTTTDGIVVTWNKASEALFGYTADEMIGQPIQKLIPDGLIPASLYIKWVLETGRANYVAPRQRKDGTIIDVAITLSTVKDAAGDVTEISAIARDVTEARKLEEQLRQAQKMEAIGRLAGGISHDFNNILTAILGNCELLLNEPSESPELRQQILEIQEAATIGESIARKLLEISRPAGSGSEVVDVGLVLTEMNSVLQGLLGENIELVLQVPPSPMTVLADRGHLEQVILNLAVNAREAISGRGAFTIDLSSVEVEARDSLEQLGLWAGSYVSMSASDTGCGIQPEILDRIFEPFFSTKGEAASGLGLSIVYQIVSQVGGNISVESRPDVGTTFRILMPRAETPSIAPPRARPLGPFAGGTILLAEDDPRVRRVLARALRDGGYRVIDAGDGASALEMAETEAGTIDLLISDLMMPVMTGEDLARALLKRRPSLRVLLISGYAQSKALTDLLGGARTELLQKPFTMSELLATVGRILETSAI